MVHIALFGLLVQTVQLLGIVHGAKGGHRQHLGLASGEHTGAVGSGQQVNLCVQGTNVVNAAAVHTLVLVFQPSTHHMLLYQVQDLLDLALFALEACIELLVHGVIDGAQALVAHIFVVGIQSLLHIFNAEVLDLLQDRRIRVGGLEALLGLAHFLNNAVDEGNDLLILLMTGHNGVEHGVVVDLVTAGLDHSHQIAGGSHGQIQIVMGALLQSGVDDDLAVYQTHIYTADGAVPRNVGDGNGSGHADHGGDLRRAIRIHAHYGSHNAYIVAHILGEQGTNGAVNAAGGEDGLLGRTSLTALERTGDPTHGIHLLFIIHAQGEEIHALAGFGAHGHVTQHIGVAVAGHNGRTGQTAHFAGLQGQLSAGQFRFPNFVVLEKHLVTSFINNIYHQGGTIVINSSRRTR